MAKKKTLILTAYYLLFLPLVAGFFFHTSAQPQILQYNYPYFFVLLILSIGLLGIIPYLAFRYIKKLGRRKFTFAVIPTIGLLILAYFFFHYRYYWLKQHPFDPYLQAPYPTVNISDYEEDDFVILAMGGSTTRNIKLEEQDRYPHLLEQVLQQEYPSARIRVVNAGMPWYTSKHSLISYETYYQQLKPDMVIVMHAINDICRSFSPPEFAMGPFAEDYSHYYGPSIRAAQARTFEGSLIDFGLQYWFSSLRKKAYDFSLDTYVSLNSYEQYVRRLVQNIQGDSAQVLLLEQRSLYKPDLSEMEQQALSFGKIYCNNGSRYASPESLGEAMQQFNQKAEEIAEEEGALFVQIGKKLPSELDFFRDDVHYTPHGTRRLAELVGEFIEQKGLIPQE